MKTVDLYRRRLRALLKKANLSTKAAADELQISERMMRYYLAGEKEIPKVVLLATEHLVGCESLRANRLVDIQTSKA